MPKIRDKAAKTLTDYRARPQDPGVIPIADYEGKSLMVSDDGKGYLANHVPPQAQPGSLSFLNERQME